MNVDLLDVNGHFRLIDEPCRHCGQSSRHGHPAGVVHANWKCSGCKRWQQEDVEERAFNELMEEPAFNQVEEA